MAPRNHAKKVIKNITQQAFLDFDYKASCRVATTGAITLSGAQTIDVVSVVAGDRVLVKNQGGGASHATNGIYVCASGAWTRATDYDADSEVTSGSFICITEGTANGDKSFVLTTDGVISVGTTALAFTILSASVTDLHSAGVDGAANQLLTDDGDGTVTSEATLTYDGTDLLVSNSASGKPLVTLNTTDASTLTTSGELKFQKTATGETTAQLGEISFHGQDDGGNPTQFGEINSTIAGAGEGAEMGRIELKIATNDGSMATGFKIQGTAVAGRVDTYLGGNSSSLIVSNGPLSTPKLKVTTTSGVYEHDTSNQFIVHTLNDRVLVWDANDDYIKFAQLSTVCFLKGTKITLPNHEQKNIEDLKLGEQILTYHIEELSNLRKKDKVKIMNWSQDSMEGSFKNSKVKNIWVNPTDKYLIINDKLKITNKHIIHIKRSNEFKFLPVEDVRIGDELFTDREHYEEIHSIEQKNEKTEVYNIEVKRNKTYFAENYLVHHYCETCSGFAERI